MSDDEANLLRHPTRAPWNKGKLIDAKAPLRPRHVWSIRTRLLVEGRTRDLVMFNLAIDSKQRGCDVVAIKVEGSGQNRQGSEREYASGSGQRRHEGLMLWLRRSTAGRGVDIAHELRFELEAGGQTRQKVAPGSGLN